MHPVRRMPRLSHIVFPAANRQPPTPRARLGIDCSEKFGEANRHHAGGPQAQRQTHEPCVCHPRVAYPGNGLSTSQYRQSPALDSANALARSLSQKRLEYATSLGTTLVTAFA